MDSSSSLVSACSGTMAKPRASHILNKFCLPLSNTASHYFSILIKHTKLEFFPSLGKAVREHDA